FSRRAKMLQLKGIATSPSMSNLQEGSSRETRCGSRGSTRTTPRAGNEGHDRRRHREVSWRQSVINQPRTYRRQQCEERKTATLHSDASFHNVGSQFPIKMVTRASCTES